MTAAVANPFGPGPDPVLFAPAMPRAIRDALIDPERDEFEQRYREAMAEAARTLDLAEVLRVLNAWREIARKTQQHGVETHRRMLERVARLQRGEEVPVVPAEDVTALIARRLAR
jgi:hypothetical protein